MKFQQTNLKNILEVRNKKIYIYFFSFIFLFILLYFSTFKNLIYSWSTNEDYSHGFLILPIAMYLAWRKKNELLNTPVQSSILGLFVILLWAFLYFVGVVGYISTFVSISMIIFLLGTSLFLFGFRVTKIVLFPICFLAFMIPIPSEIYTYVTTPLKLMVTTTTTHILTFFHIPVFQEGNLIKLPNYSMKVIDACSGLRSLVSVVAFASLMGHLTINSYTKKLVLFLLSFPVSFIGNIFRITTTVLLATYVSVKAAEGFSHTLAGITTFILCILILFFITILLKNNE